MTPTTTRKPINPVGDTIARLKELGHENPDHDAVAAAWRDALYPELVLRVGTRISARLTSDQIDAFEALLDDDQDGTGAWLDENAPWHGEVAAEQFAVLLAEAVQWFIRIGAHR